MSLINVEKTIALDVYDHDTTPSVIKTMQMDSGTRTVFAELQNSRQTYDIGQNASVSLIVLRPDKTKVQITGETYPTAETTVDGETITLYGASAELTQLALAVKGKIKAQFKITSGDQELRTEIFAINNGEALDAGDGDWAGDLDGHNLDEMAQSIEDLSSDVSEIQGDVSTLKEDFTNLTEVEYSKNLYDENALTDGYLNPDGAIHADNGSGWKTTDFIPCSGGNAFIATCKSSNGSRSKAVAFFVTEYTEDKQTVIKQTNQTSVQGFTVSSNAAWLRLCNKPSQRDEYMISAGTEILPYTTFRKNTVVKNDRLTGITYGNIAPDGVTYKNIDSKITNLFVPSSFAEQTLLYPNEGCLTSAGTIISLSNCYVSDYIDCRYIDAIHYTGKSYYDGVCVVFYDIDENPMSYFPEERGVISVDSDIIVPKNARYMRIGDYSKSTSRTVIVKYSTAFNFAGHWSGKKWVCVGDSLTEINSRTTMHYHDYIANATGISVVNMGLSGSGYAKKSDNNGAFYQRISDVPLDADVVTIFGSGNDGSSGLDIGEPTDSGTTTLCGCINTTIDNLIARLPDVSLGIVAPTPWTGNQPSNANCFMAKYTEALKSICANRSIPFLDLYHCSNLRPWTEEGRTACYSKDDGNGVHPDENGHKLIAPRFKAFLETLLL